MDGLNLSEAGLRNRDAIRALEARSGVKLHECYQCGKCAAGCPMGESMDLTPRQVIRYLQLGLLDEALNARSPWVCSTCHTCSARCPHNVEVSELMETVRQEANRRGIQPERRAALFTKDFLAPVRMFGRSHEMTMTAMYNLTSGRLLQNFGYVPKMISGKKLAVFPSKVKDPGAIKRLMENCEREAEKR